MVDGLLVLIFFGVGFFYGYVLGGANVEVQYEWLLERMDREELAWELKKEVVNE